MGLFAEYVCNLTGYDKYLPASGGAEACETAVKAARRWGYYVKGIEDGKAQVVVAKNNFWGRSITGSGACTDPLRFTAFGPFTPGFPIVEYNNLEALETMLKNDPNICAVMLEPI